MSVSSIHHNGRFALASKKGTCNYLVLERDDNNINLTINFLEKNKAVQINELKKSSFVYYSFFVFFRSYV